VNQRNWEPIRINNTGPQLSHLLFADDVLLFIKAKSSQFRFVLELFDEFSKASGLKINLSKSRALFSSGIPQAKIHKHTTISGIRNTNSFINILASQFLRAAKEK
jgi:hypothetical protein